MVIDRDMDFKNKDELSTHAQISVQPLPKKQEDIMEALLIEYKEGIQEVNKRWRTYVDNKYKAYAFIFG